LEDTIAAIATPPGSGGIGIVRVSGAKAVYIARLLFKPSRKSVDFVSHHLYHGDIIAPETGKSIDEVLISLMKKPHSYTGEDTLEIYCHGGSLILNAVLGETINAGCRLALPGEFTRRAFLNNRLDLSQAEAVLDIITAKTERGRDIALSHLKGDLSEKIETLRRRIVDVLALVEMSIDFQEDVSERCFPGSKEEGKQGQDIALQIEGIVRELQDMLKTCRHGKIFRDGFNVVIVGRPNVGKSSLLNALLGEKRAIVTPIAGTTRDIIEEFIDIEGVTIKLVDTAGIREPENIMEEEGVAFSMDRLSSADLAIILIDGSEDISDDDRRIIAENKDENIMVAVNKIDLPLKIALSDVDSLLPGRDILCISAKYGDGLPAIKEAIRKAALSTDVYDRPDAVIASIRHRTALDKAVSFLLQAGEGVMKNVSPELLAIDLNDALAGIGEITGKTASEDVLDRIFSQFCVGK
jgi:tRNA modification GTPase